MCEKEEEEEGIKMCLILLLLLENIADEAFIWDISIFGGFFFSETFEGFNDETSNDFNKNNNHDVIVKIVKKQPS